MEKNRTVFALLLTLAMAMALCVPVFAAETGNSAETVANGDKVIVPLNADDIVDFSDVISEMPPIVLGTPDMAEYDDSPNIQTRASGFLFSMTANAVYELLVTGSAKTFTESDLTIIISTLAENCHIATDQMRQLKSAVAIMMPVPVCMSRICMLMFMRDPFREKSIHSLLLRRNILIVALSRIKQGWDMFPETCLSIARHEEHCDEKDVSTLYYHRDSCRCFGIFHLSGNPGWHRNI